MRYTFANCVLDTNRRELRCAGEVVRTRPKVYEVLTYLLEQRDRAVPKDELLAECWPGRVVGDATLNSVLKEIRQAIGDSGRSQQYVRTLRGQGYRFVARVEEVPAETAAPVTPAGPSPRAEREFKQVSVLDCGIHDADTLAAELGPEEMDTLMRSFFAAAKAVLERYGGTVTQWEGSGFTALFGAPQALEDHARRAAAAAVELREALAAGGRKHGAKLSAGLHTGEVIVGNLDDSEQLFTAVGSTTNIAHRIRAVAGPSILATRKLYALVETDIAAREVAEAADLPALVEITGLTALHGGVPRRDGRLRSRFVGRDDEVVFIRKRLELAQSGAGQAVCLSGEPGIGKSRLLRELLRGFGAAEADCIQANCLAYRQASPYFSLQQVLRTICRLGPADDREIVAERVRTLGADAGLDSDDIGLLLALLDASDSRLQRSTVDRVFLSANRLILHTAVSRPLVLAIEDLHWLDSTSEQWLAIFVQRIRTLPVLLLVTYRPAYRSAWLGHSHVTQLALPRLNDMDSAALISSLSARLPDAPEIRRRIVNNAQGNPFFLEELTFNLAAEDAADVDAVPTTVQAVLGSRIDQLDAADKSLLQTAAVVGATVPRDLLVALEPDSNIEASLRRLEEAELLFEDPTTVGRRYQFKHALTRDVAYQSLLSNSRRNRHREIAEACETRFPETVRTQPEVLAHHFDEAGSTAKAAAYWKQAGIRAAERYANPEAVLHFERALAAGELLPQTRELKTVQLDTYLQLGPPLMSSKAFTAPAVEAAYLKARRLCDDIGTQDQLMTVLWGLWLHYAHRGHIDEARPLARHIEEIAAGVDDDGLRLQAHHAVWTTELWHGDPHLCYEHAKAGIGIYDADKHVSHKFLYGGHDPGVCARGSAAIAAWFLGRPQECIELTRAGAELAESLEHPYSRIITMHDFMLVETLRGNPEVAGRYGRMAIDACTDQHVPNYLAVAHIFAGYGEAVCGDFDAGMAQLMDGLERYRALGAERNLAPYLLLLVELCLTAGRWEQGLEAVDEAAELIGRTQEIRWLPEIWRNRGELQLLQSPETAAEARATFEKALASARDQGCRSFELRAATSLARLLKRRDVLVPVYEQFEEGFDTRDLRKATALLEELT